MTEADLRVTAVVITYNRREEVARSLAELHGVPERPPIVLVDNGSNDGTVPFVTREFPRVEVIAAGANLGAAARNLGVLRARTRYVALCDDDTWWAPGSLRRAADLLDAHAQAAVLTARVLVGQESREDPICRVLEASPLPADGNLPGKPLLGFLAGASVVRRSAFLEAGGFERRFFVGGEEELLAIDLAVRGWQLFYVPELLVHHYPSPRRNGRLRNWHTLRNRLWVSWLRRPASEAARRTFQALRQIWRDRAAFRSFAGAVAGLPWALRNRRVVPRQIEEGLRLLERK